MSLLNFVVASYLSWHVATLCLFSSTSTWVTSFSSPADAWICSAQPFSKFARSVLLDKEGQAPRRQIWFGPRCHTVQTGILAYVCNRCCAASSKWLGSYIMSLWIFLLNKNHDRYLHCETVKASVLEWKRNMYLETCCTLLHSCLYLQFSQSMTEENLRLVDSRHECRRLLFLTHRFSKHASRRRLLLGAMELSLEGRHCAALLWWDVTWHDSQEVSWHFEFEDEMTACSL